MYIRILDRSDAKSYQTLRLEALSTNPEAFLTTQEQFAKRSLPEVEEQLAPVADKYTFGAFTSDENALVATITFVRAQAEKTHHVGEVVGMYVTPNARRQGVGKMLLQELITHAKATVGLTQLKLSVVTDNTSAVHLYQSVGFITYGHERMALRVGTQYWDELHMVLFLEAKSAPVEWAEKGFSHVTLDVRQLDVSLAFYQNILGFELKHRGRIDAYLEFGNAWLCLQERPELKTRDRQIGVNHVAFYLHPAQFEDAVRALRAANTSIVRGPLERGGGMTVNFLDPDGIELEFYTGTLKGRMKVWK